MCLSYKHAMKYHHRIILVLLLIQLLLPTSTTIPNMDNAPNTDDNNDGGSTTLTKMKNISSVIQYKIQSITKKYHWAMYKAFDTYNLNILWMWSNVHELLNRPDRVEKFSFPVALQAKKLRSDRNYDLHYISFHRHKCWYGNFLCLYDFYLKIPSNYQKQLRHRLE